jgi:hypothetical protein
MFLTTHKVLDGWAEGLWGWAESNGDLLWWLFLGSICSLVACALLLPVIVVRLPSDYFASSRARRKEPRTFVATCLRLLKNLVGLVFVLAGILMLVLPGQGVLTILIGVILLNFPGKRRLERRIVGRPSIIKMLNAIRAWRSLPPLIVD